MAGHNIEFLPESNINTADFLLDGIAYELKSPFTNRPDKLERNIKRALKQSKNIILDSSRIKGLRDDKLRCFLIKKAQEQKQIGNLIFITRHGQIIDITSLIWYHRGNEVPARGSMLLPQELPFYIQEYSYFTESS